MSATTRALVLLALAAGCRSGSHLLGGDQPLELQLDSPTYAAFAGDQAIRVAGSVNRSDATVTVEGDPVELTDDLHFTVDVPLDGPYRNIDVVAMSGDEKQSLRVPVFQGQDPALTWPEAISLRVLQPGLDAMAGQLDPIVDAVPWDDLISSAMPAVDQGFLVLTPGGASHSSATVALQGAEGGIETGIVLHDLELAYDLTISFGPIGFSGPMTITYDAVTIGMLAVPAVDDGGRISLSLESPAVEMGTPAIAVDGLDSSVLDLLLGDRSSSINDQVNAQIGDVLGSQLGTMELGGPVAFRSDVMGARMALALVDLAGASDGLGIGLDAQISGLSDAGVGAFPAPRATGLQPAGAQMAMGLHEGLFQAMLAGDLLAEMSQDITLTGPAGEFIGAGLRDLPGGEQAPQADGWCLRIAPGDARLARMQTGVAPLAEIYLPDFQFHAGTVSGDTCNPWLDASLAVEIGLDVADGTALSMGFTVADSAVLAYGATPGSYDEAALAEGLQNTVQTFLLLAGSAYQLDLGGLLSGLGGPDAGPLGALFSNLDLQIVGSVPLLDEEDQPIEGAYAVTMDAWAE